MLPDEVVVELFRRGYMHATPDPLRDCLSQAGSRFWRGGRILLFLKANRGPGRNARVPTWAESKADPRAYGKPVHALHAPAEIAGPGSRPGAFPTPEIRAGMSAGSHPRFGCGLADRKGGA